MARSKKKRWSYNAGERGRNWVRAYERPNGDLFIEWFDHEGQRKRRRLKGISDKNAAKEKADALAAEFAKTQKPTSTPITVGRLLDLYLREVTPTKGASKRGHDNRAKQVWKAFLDAQPEVDRRSTRHPSSLDRVDWDRFIQQRRKGEIPGWEKPVKDRQVEYDLKFMISVLNWAVGSGERGQKFLEANPWSGDIRRAQRWEMPKEKNPNRPGMRDDIRDGLMAHAPNKQLGPALILGRETRRRNNSIRQLLWSDLDLGDEPTVRWRGEKDKSGRETTTPLTQRAAEVLRQAPWRSKGNVPVFPSANNPTKPTSRETFQAWLRTAKQRLLRSTPEGERDALRKTLEGLGFHAEKRAGVRDPAFRELPPAIQEALAGTNYNTLRTVYDEVSLDDMRDASGTLEKVRSGPIDTGN